MYTLPQDSRYWNPSFLTQSTLNNFASYDCYGSPTYNIHAVINPTRPESDFITVWLACDQHLLEGDLWDNNYIKVSKRSEDGVKDGKIEITGTMATAIETIIARANLFQYSPIETLTDLIVRCEKQTTLQDDTRRLKGKADLIDRENKLIIDLKCVGSMQNFMRDISFKGFINPYNWYVRQLAYYRSLNGDMDYEGELITIAHDGQCIVIRITKDILDFAWAMIEKDIDRLKAALSNPTSFAVTLRMPPDFSSTHAVRSNDPESDDGFEIL